MKYRARAGFALVILGSGRIGASKLGLCYAVATLRQMRRLPR